MEIVYVGGNRIPSNRALLISNGEWKRLSGILTRKIDEEDAAEDNKRLKEKRRGLSKKMVNGWNNTELNKTKKILEQKQKVLYELETKRRQRDEELKREMLEARNAIIERSHKLKFEERDAVKTFNRAIQHSEMFKERAIQLKFNKTTREKMAERDLLMAHEQTRMEERYRKDKMNDKQKNNALKRANAETLLKELKYREEKRLGDRIALYECGKAELNDIAAEIEKVREKDKAEKLAAKKKMQKTIAENLELVTMNEKMRGVEEWEEDMMTAIMAETKIILAKTRRLKEIELKKIKQVKLEEIRTRMIVDWPTKETGWAESDISNAVHAEEQRYMDGRCKNNELVIKRAEYMESSKKLWEEEVMRRKELIALDRELEMERREREKGLLTEYAELHRNIKTEKTHEFRRQLDKQCNDKITVLLADRQDDINRHNAFEQQWHKEDEQFIAFARNMIEKKKMAGNPIVPLLKVVKDYQEKNNLYVDQDNKVAKKPPKGTTYTSRIVRQID